MHIIHARIFTISSGSAQVGLLAVGKSIEATFGLLCKWDRGGGGRRESGKPTWLGFPLGFWAYVVGEDERKRGTEGAYVSALRSIRWFSLAHACLPCTEEKTEREWQGTLARCIQLLPFSFSAKVFSLPPLKENEVYPPFASSLLSSPLLGFGSLLPCLPPLSPRLHNLKVSPELPKPPRRLLHTGSGGGGGALH